MIVALMFLAVWLAFGFVLSLLKACLEPVATVVDYWVQQWV